MQVCSESSLTAGGHFEPSFCCARSASSSSTLSVDGLAAASAFDAEQALLSSADTYWCSAALSKGKLATWTGTLGSRRTAVGVRVEWAYAPGRVKVLTRFVQPVA